MAILFAVVARGSTILAKHAWCGGNFLEVTEQILAKIPSENNKLTYSHGNYLFHYICQDRIIYLCITDDNFERSRAFTFLNEIKKRFQTTYGSRAQTALPYAMNSEFSSVLAAQLKYHSENKGPDQMAETQAQVDELKGIMVRNIDLVAQRGEKLELLIDKTENLVDSSVTFKTTSRNLARAMCMKNLKLTIIIAIVSIFGMFFQTALWYSVLASPPEVCLTAAPVSPKDHTLCKMDCPLPFEHGGATMPHSKAQRQASERKGNLDPNLMIFKKVMEEHEAVKTNF